jgi:hypothetical protein|tara:strand:+ start:933 stop:1169 length:237 start_codon:yes stop_codon:yes gene_type:complete
MEKFIILMVIGISLRFYTINLQILNGRRRPTGRTTILKVRSKGTFMTLITTEIEGVPSKIRTQITKTRLHLLIIFQNI